jgi:hypothetical protein
LPCQQHLCFRGGAWGGDFMLWIAATRTLGWLHGLANDGEQLGRERVEIKPRPEAGRRRPPRPWRRRSGPSAARPSRAAAQLALAWRSPPAQTCLVPGPKLPWGPSCTTVFSRPSCSRSSLQAAPQPPHGCVLHGTVSARLLSMSAPQTGLGPPAQQGPLPARLAEGSIA